MTNQVPPGYRPLSAPVHQTACSPPAAREGRVRSPFGLEFFRRLISALRQWLAWSARLARVFASEVGTIRSRIGSSRKSTFVYLGPSSYRQPNRHYVSCEATAGRIQGMQYMLASHPKATAFDKRLFLEGWDMGAKWAARYMHSPECHKLYTAELASEHIMQQLEALQGFMQQLEALQGSKHGQFKPAFIAGVTRRV